MMRWDIVWNLQYVLLMWCIYLDSEWGVPLAQCYGILAVNTYTISIITSYYNGNYNDNENILFDHNIQIYITDLQ